MRTSHISFQLLTAAPLLLLTASSSRAATFPLVKDWQGADFYKDWWWWTGEDPTHGYVDYISKEAAQSQGLTYVDPLSNQLILKAGTDRLNTTVRGRPSQRIQSNTAYGDAVIIAKFTHMPQGLGSWPAFWTCTTDTWPVGGEIDIVEGANDQGTNLVTLHTTAGCSQRSDSLHSLTDTGKQLYLGTSNGHESCHKQPGCGQRFNTATTSSGGFGGLSFANAFNTNGGGYYALVRDLKPGGSGISVYFWPITADPKTIPLAVRAAAHGDAVPQSVDTDAKSLAAAGWGIPQARYPLPEDGGACELDDFFTDHSIIINLTFCGDWASATFAGTPGAPKGVTCEEFVRKNPWAYLDAYFAIDYVRVFASQTASPSKADKPDSPAAADKASAPATSNAPSPAKGSLFTAEMFSDLKESDDC